MCCLMTTPWWEVHAEARGPSTGGGCRPRALPPPSQIPHDPSAYPLPPPRGPVRPPGPPLGNTAGGRWATHSFSPSAPPLAASSSSSSLPLARLFGRRGDRDDIRTSEAANPRIGSDRDRRLLVLPNQPPPPPLRFDSRGGAGTSFFVGMVPRDRVNVAGAGAGASSVGSAERIVQEPILNKKCEKKAPKKIHKSEREKLKRDKQNDLFSELGTMLETDRQNNGKACILGDTTRILKDLLSQVESLRKENSALKNESHYVALERNELHDDNSMLRNEILELQNELRMRLEGNPIWSQGTTRSVLAVSHPTSCVFPVQHSPHLPVIATTALPPQQPVIELRELQLFPEAASTEGSELSQDQENSNNVTRPQVRYGTNRFSILPRMVDKQQCSSGTSEEDGLGRVSIHNETSD